MSTFTTMKCNWLLFLIFACLMNACKKDEEEVVPPNISFTYSSAYCQTLPAVIVFTASSSGESIVWDFGDGTSGSGFSVQHTYTAFGNYIVKATATKSGLTSIHSKNIPVSFHRRAVIKELEILQVPTFKFGGIDWDPGTLPDLSYKITFPGDTVYQPATVLNNVENGIFSIIPPKGTFNFSDDVSFEVYDIDAGNVPDRELMGTVKFKFAQVLPVSPVYTDSVQITNGSIRLKLKFEFQL